MSYLRYTLTQGELKELLSLLTSFSVDKIHIENDDRGLTNVLFDAKTENDYNLVHSMMTSKSSFAEYVVNNLEKVSGKQIKPSNDTDSQFAINLDSRKFSTEYAHRTFALLTVSYKNGKEVDATLDVCNYPGKLISRMTEFMENSYNSYRSATNVSDIELPIFNPNGREAMLRWTLGSGKTKAKFCTKCVIINANDMDFKPPKTGDSQISDTSCSSDYKKEKYALVTTVTKENGDIETDVTISNNKKYLEDCMTSSLRRSYYNHYNSEKTSYIEDIKLLDKCNKFSWIERDGRTDKKFTLSYTIVSAADVAFAQD